MKYKERVFLKKMIYKMSMNKATLTPLPDIWLLEKIYICHF